MCESQILYALTETPEQKTVLRSEQFVFTSFQSVCQGTETEQSKTEIQ